MKISITATHDNHNTSSKNTVKVLPSGIYGTKALTVDQKLPVDWREREREYTAHGENQLIY